MICVFIYLVFLETKGAKAAKAAKAEAKVEEIDAVDEDGAKAEAKDAGRNRAASSAKGSKEVWSKESDYY